jgi:hypothetical protein
MDVNIFNNFITTRQENLPSFVRSGNEEFNWLNFASLEIWHTPTSVQQLAGTVTQWDDISGNDRHAQVINGATAPTYTASDADFNNYPSVTFGTSSNMRLEYNGISIPSTKWTFIYVLKPSSTTGTPTLFDAQTGRLVNYAYHNGSGLNDYCYFDTAQRHVGGVPDTTTKILEFSLNSLTNVGEVFVNGVSVGTNTYASRNIGGSVGLGGRSNASGGGIPFVGKMAEFVVLSDVLNSSQRSQYIGSYNYI